VGVDAGGEPDRAGEALAERGEGVPLVGRPRREEAKEPPARRGGALELEQAEGQRPRFFGREAEEEGLEEGVVSPVGHAAAGYGEARFERHANRPGEVLESRRATPL